MPLRDDSCYFKSCQYLLVKECEPLISRRDSRSSVSEKYSWHLIFESLRLELLWTVFDPKDSGWGEAWICGIQPQNAREMEKLWQKRASCPTFSFQHLLASSSSTHMLFHFLLFFHFLMIISFFFEPYNTVRHYMSLYIPHCCLEEYKIYFSTWLFKQFFKLTV